MEVSALPAAWPVESPGPEVTPAPVLRLGSFLPFRLLVLPPAGSNVGPFPRCTLRRPTPDPAWTPRSAACRAWPSGRRRPTSIACRELPRCRLRALQQDVSVRPRFFPPRWSLRLAQGAGLRSQSAEFWGANSLVRTWSVWPPPQTEAASGGFFPSLVSFTYSRVLWKW